jgi:hypothetical protein
MPSRIGADEGPLWGREPVVGTGFRAFRRGWVRIAYATWSGLVGAPPTGGYALFASRAAMSLYRGLLSVLVQGRAPGPTGVAAAAPGLGTPPGVPRALTPDRNRRTPRSCNWRAPRWTRRKGPSVTTGEELASPPPAVGGLPDGWAPVSGGGRGWPGGRPASPSWCLRVSSRVSVARSAGLRGKGRGGIRSPW